MVATESPSDVDLEQHGEGPARSRVLEMIAALGPVTAGELARQLSVTSAAVRRHLSALQTDGLVTTQPNVPGARGRGRPARRYITTARGHNELTGGYSHIALQALRFLRQRGEGTGVAEFAATCATDVAHRYAEQVRGHDVSTRALHLAQALSDDGYAASVRPVPGTAAIQLCQGHCPVHAVAQEFPELCDAEAQAFADLLGSHVQRLSTIAAGAHVCTINIPLATQPASPPHSPYDTRDKDNI